MCCNSFTDGSWAAAAPALTIKGAITKSGKLDSRMTSVKLPLAAVFTACVDGCKREEGVRRLYLKARVQLQEVVLLAL